MLPGMKRAPRIAIVGAGNLGTALTLSLHGAGFKIDRVVGHAKGDSLACVRKLARKVGAGFSLNLSGCEADVIWFCVPDAAIARAARGAETATGWAGKIALHSSGALTSDELDVLRKRGASVASVHPLMTFVRGSRPGLVGVPFAMEGDPAAVRVARRIVRGLGGQAFAIRKEQKGAYHAWGTFASPLLTALLAATEHVAAVAGVKGTTVARRMMPILQQTLANYAVVGAPAGFSGPIVRGDVDTVKRHLRVLRGVPAAREVYLALAQAALHYLPAKNKAGLKRILDSSRV